MHPIERSHYDDHLSPLTEKSLLWCDHVNCTELMKVTGADAKLKEVSPEVYGGEHRPNTTLGLQPSQQIRPLSCRFDATRQHLACKLLVSVVVIEQ